MFQNGVTHISLNAHEIVICIETISYFLNSNFERYVLLLDAIKAFDKINHVKGICCWKVNNLTLELLVIYFK
jgi:hypothetical protein